METGAWITFVVIAGFVWGGFAFLVALAFRKEAGKRDDEHPAPEGGR